MWQGNVNYKCAWLWLGVLAFFHVFLLICSGQAALRSRLKPLSEGVSGTSAVSAWRWKDSSGRNHRDAFEHSTPTAKMSPFSDGSF